MNHGEHGEHGEEITAVDIESLCGRGEIGFPPCSPWFNSWLR